MAPALGLLYARYNAGRKDSALRFSSLKIIQKSASKRGFFRKHLPFALLVAALVASVVGLANPQVLVSAAEIGVNLAIVLDVSESMAASDYEPTRLDAAKGAMAKLVRGIGHDSNVGVVLFGSGATTASYLTPDRERTLGSISSIGHGSGATAVGDGLVLGVDMVSSIPDRKNVIILLSDGVQNSGFATPGEAAEYARMSDVRVHTIGLGSEEPVFVRNDVYGTPQYAQLDEQMLRDISGQTDGRYFKSVDEETLNGVFLEIADSIEYETEYSSVKDWFFTAAVALLLANAYVVYGRYRIAA